VYDGRGEVNLLRRWRLGRGTYVAQGGGGDIFVLERGARGEVVVWCDGEGWYLAVEVAPYLTDYAIALSPFPFDQRGAPVRYPALVGYYALRGLGRKLEDWPTLYHQACEQVPREMLGGLSGERCYTDFWLYFEDESRSIHEMVMHLLGYIRQDLDKVLANWPAGAEARRGLAEVVGNLIYRLLGEGLAKNAIESARMPYRQWKKANRGKDAIAFVKEHYVKDPVLGVTQRELRRCDPAGYEAFHSRCHYLGVDPSSILPSSREDIDGLLEALGRTPSYRESVARAVRGGGKPARRLSKAYRALQRRRSEGKRRRKKPS
jgi:hypothetical protein